MYARRGYEAEARERLTNVGMLVASGFIAGEAITGMLLAALVLGGVPSITHLLTGQLEFPFVHSVGAWLSLAIFALVGYGLMGIPLRAHKNLPP